jgi:TonB family protein
VSFFDIDGRHDELDGVGSAISRREAVLTSLLIHAIAVIVMLVMPDTRWFAQAVPDGAVPVQARDERSLPFMLVEATPRPSPPPERPRVASDLDRRAASPERVPQPTNDMPMSRGNSADMLDGAIAEPARGPATPAPPSASLPAPPVSSNGAGAPVPRPAEARPASGGLGESLRNIDQLIKRERFDNPTGGPNLDDPHISFDSKGVDFGPWLTRFVAQVKRNWLIPYAAMTMRGRVVLTFYVHRDGRISDLKTVKPSDIGAFNTAAFQALVQSNPTLQLPPEYPDDKVLFTVTFFYNERPDGR